MSILYTIGVLLLIGALCFGVVILACGIFIARTLFEEWKEQWRNRP